MAWIIAHRQPRLLGHNTNGPNGTRHCFLCLNALSKTFRCPRWKHSLVSRPPPTLDTLLRFSLLSFAITFDLVEPIFFLQFDYYIYFIFYHSGRSLAPSWRMGLEAFCMGKENHGMGRLFFFLLALHSLCMDGYYYLVLQCITNFALAYRKRGRMDFLLARMVYPIAHRGLIHWIPGGYTYGFGFTALFSGIYRTGCEVERRNAGILLGFPSDALQIHWRMSTTVTSGLDWLCVVSRSRLDGDLACLLWVDTWRSHIPTHVSSLTPPNSQLLGSWRTLLGAVNLDANSPPLVSEMREFSSMAAVLLVIIR